MLINRKEFVKKLKFVRSFTSSNGPTQLVKAEITKGSLVLSAMCLSNYVRVPVFVVPEKEEPCEFLFDGAKVETLIKTLDEGDVKLTVGQRLYIKQGKTKRSWEIADVEGYPNPPKIGSSPLEVCVGFEELQEAVNSVIFAIEAGSDKDYLEGVCITPNFIVAASETKAAGYRINTGIQDAVVIDPSLLAVLKGINFDDVDTVKFIGAGNWVGITVGDYEARVATKPVVPYPVDAVIKMIETSISATSNTVVLDRDEFIKQLTTACIYSDVAHKAVEDYSLYIKSEGGNLMLNMEVSAGIMDDVLKCPTTEGEFEITVAPAPLKSAVNSAPVGELVLSNDNGRPVCLHVDDTWGYAQSELRVK